MKYHDVASIYKALSVLEQPYLLLVIQGSDDFFREDCAERYLDMWKKKVPNGEVVRLTAAELMSQKDRLHGGASLFGNKTLYVIDGPSSIKGKKSGEWLSLLKGADPDMSFLFIDSEAAPKDLISAADETGAAFIIEPMKPWERQPFIVSWIAAYVKKRGKAIDKEAASMLAQAYSSDRQGLIQELEKLCVYRLNETMVSRQDVEEIGSIDVQPTMWQLLDGLLAGDAKAVTSCLVQSSDMHDIAVLRFVKNQLEKLLAVLEGEAPPRNKAQERQLTVARKRGVPTIVSWINRLKMQEVAIRSGLEESEEGSLLPFFLTMCVHQ